jgi:hypothetical protein
MNEIDALTIAPQRVLVLGGSGYIGGVSSGTMQSGQRQGHGQVVLTY